MAGKSSKSNNRGTDLFGYFVSGKDKQYHTNEFAYSPPGSAPAAPGGLTATGGIINDYTSGSNAYRAHTFTTSGAFEVTSLGNYGANIEFLVVAGGGGGGGSRDNYAGQGGGGAGGLITNMPGVATPGPSPNPSVPLTRSVTFDVAEGGTYPVVVGGGGVGGMYPGGGLGGGGTGNSGTPSVLTHTSAPKTITATGGGGGGAATDVSGGNALTGGSGGGGSGYPTTVQSGANAVPNSNPDRQGHPGGQGKPGGPQSSGGGGGGAGGAGEVGSDPGSSRAARGGQGVSVSITGTATVYAGGGGAGAYLNPYNTDWAGSPSHPPNGGGGGQGGTGGGNTKAHTRGEPGTPGLGGGGGGATAHHPPNGPRRGGDGGGGVVIVRYQIGTITAQQKATGGVVSYYDGKTIHTFTGNGTFATTSNWDAGTNEVEYVCVGGGGGGGGTDPNCWGAGGGGAGQMRVGTTTISHPSPVAIAIGAGGRGGTKYDANPASNGSNTTAAFPAGTITGYGGGFGSSNAPNTQNAGANGNNHPSTPSGSGSGGGGSKNGNGGAGGPAAKGAYPGGNMPGTNNGYVGAGGGGAGGAGQIGSPDATQSGPQIATYGAGGIGLQVPTTFRNPLVIYDGVHTGAQHYLAGGGGGGLFNPNPQTNPDRGGKGGGGAGGGGAPGVPGSRGAAGGTNTGGGGGGGGSFNDPTVFYGGHGGSGIVLIAYPT